MCIKKSIIDPVVETQLWMNQLADACSGSRSVAGFCGLIVFCKVTWCKLPCVVWLAKPAGLQGKPIQGVLTLLIAVGEGFARARRFWCQYLEAPQLVSQAQLVVGSQGNTGRGP